MTHHPTNTKIYNLDVPQLTKVPMPLYGEVIGVSRNLEKTRYIKRTIQFTDGGKQYDGWVDNETGEILNLRE